MNTINPISPKHVYYIVLIAISVIIIIDFSVHMSLLATDKSIVIFIGTTIIGVVFITLLTKYLRNNVYVYLIDNKDLIVGNAFMRQTFNLLAIESIKANSSRGTFYTITTKTGKSFEFVSVEDEPVLELIRIMEQAKREDNR
jgi:hypothetical protein